METPLDKPTTDDRDAWRMYWQQHGQPWRTEPEISAERQAYLAARRSVIPDIVQGIYPFKDVAPKLTRADTEWLLATHEEGRGPVDWQDASQQERTGLDMRGTDLAGTPETHLDLSNLPMARTRFGLTLGEAVRISEEAQEQARADLSFVDFHSAQVQGANLRDAEMKGANLLSAQMKGADLSSAQMQGAILSSAQMQGADLHSAQMKGANLFIAQMQGAILSSAQMQGTNLRAAQMQGADLRAAQIQGADLRDAEMQGANLRGVTFDSQTRLDEVTLDATIQVADVTWGDVNLVNIDWTPVARLGDEVLARQSHQADTTLKRAVRSYRLAERRDAYRAAVRAYRLLATALRNQGMNEEADRFAYRARLMQQGVIRRQGWQSWGTYVWSLVLSALAGYGYQPVRTFGWYLLSLLGFALAYMNFGAINNHAFSFHEAMIFSLTSFHGRGFFPGGLTLDAPITTIAAIEAVIGLFIEISFIATFTQRYFGK